MAFEPLLPAHASAKNQEVANDPAQLGLEELEMVATLGQHDRRTPLLDGLDHVVDDQPVAGGVRGQVPVDVPDLRLCRGIGRTPSRLPSNQLPRDLALAGKPLRVDRVSNRAQLELEDWVVPIASMGRRGESCHVAGVHFPHHVLEGDG